MTPFRPARIRRILGANSVLSIQGGYPNPKIQHLVPMKLISIEKVIQIIRDIRPFVAATLAQFPRTDGSPRNQMHVVVMLPNAAAYGVISLPILGLQEDYRAPYDKIAAAKASLCKRTGVNSSKVLNDAPFLLETGDVVYQGGVNLDGLVVATSGGPAQIDEAISMTIALLIKAHYQIAVRAMQDQIADGGPYEIS